MQLEMGLIDVEFHGESFRLKKCENSRHVTALFSDCQYKKNNKLFRNCSFFSCACKPGRMIVQSETVNHARGVNSDLYGLALLFSS